MKIALKELGTIITGNTPSKSETRYWDSDDICFVKPDIISEDGITDLYRSNEHISEYARYKARIVTKDSLFVTCIGSIGKIGLVSSDEMAFNQQINAIIPNEKILPRYLAYSLLRNQSRLQAIANAPVVPIINKTQFGDFLINYNPDKEKQSAIVKILDSVDNIIKIKKRVMKAFDDLIKARFVEMFGDLYLNTFKWDMKTIGELCTEIKSGLSRKLSNSDIGLPVIRSTNMINGELNTDDIKFWYVKDPQGACTDNYVLNDGDILVNFINSIAHIGKVCIFKDIGRPCIYTTNILRMQLNESCNKYFFKYFTQTDCYTHQLKRIIQPAVNQASFTTVNYKKILIPLPPVELQKTFEDFVTQVDKSKVVYLKAARKYHKQSKVVEMKMSQC